MRTHATASKYKILVLMDKSKASHKTLKDGVDLAKLIGGSIDIFQVEPPTTVVRYENQIASMRAIDEERHKQEIALREIASIIKNEEGVPVVGNFTFGNVKNEIKSHIEKTAPDIVVLGKRKKKLIGILGDQVTEDLVRHYAGTILISGGKKGLAGLDKQSIGFLNTSDGVEKIALVNDLVKHIKNPLKVFKTTTPASASQNKEHNSSSTEETKKRTIVYEFDSKNDSIDQMANFISKNNLAFLCVPNNSKENTSLRKRLGQKVVKTIEKTNIPVLVLNSNSNVNVQTL